MAAVHGIKKWDLEQNHWRAIASLEEAKRALSIVKVEEIKHNESDEINYIIIGDGYRVENVTNDVTKVSDRNKEIANAVAYFEKRHENYAIEIMLVDNDAPLTKESRFLAEYIDSLAFQKNVKTISFIGSSKCGVMAFDLIKYFRCSASLYKTRLYSLSAPYKGTIMASPLYLEREIEKMVHAKISNKALADKISKSVLNEYYKVFSNSHMDLDIAIPGGVPGRMLNVYDPTFLEKIFSSDNITAYYRGVYFQNISTEIGTKTLKEVLKSGNLAGLGLCILNDCVQDGPSDGMVLRSSSRAIDDQICKKSRTIYAPHNILSIPKFSKEIYDIVDENITGKRMVLKPKK